MITRLAVVFLALVPVLAGSLVAIQASAAPPSQQVREEGRKACEADVHRLCDEFIPNEEEISACLKRQARQLSPGCRKIMSHG